MGYCNGIVCIYYFGYVYLINPTTKQNRILSPECRSGWSSEFPVSVGLGRDIVTGDYKVILMYLFENTNLVKAEVFNLNTGGRRRYISFPAFYDQLSHDKISIFANGSLYWLKNSDTFWMAELTKLAAIDLHTEEFRDVLLPSLYKKYSKSVYLWSLRDRLCLSDMLQQYPNEDVWGLQQEDPTVKWEKILSINILSLDSLDPNYWKLGLAAFYVKSIEEKSDYEPTKNILEQFRGCSTVMYTENLVSSI